MKNKNLSVYLALFFGTYGVHRFYLKGWLDLGAWLHVLVTSIGLIGLRRVWILGQDDQLAWALLPFLGFSLFASCLAAIVYGLAPQAKWNKAYNGNVPQDHVAGGSSGITIFGVILALLLGATALMSVIAYTSQRYFEYAAVPA